MRLQPLTNFLESQERHVDASVTEGHPLAMHHILLELYTIAKPYIFPVAVLLIGMELRRRGYLRDSGSTTTRAFQALEETAATMVASRVAIVRDLKNPARPDVGNWTPAEAARVQREVMDLVMAAGRPHIEALRAQGALPADQEAMVRALVEAAVERHRLDEAAMTPSRASLPEVTTPVAADRPTTVPAAPAP